ncbi:unnamed protein product, partial [Iphiclides podalirius]
MSSVHHKLYGCGTLTKTPWKTFSVLLEVTGAATQTLRLKNLKAHLRHYESIISQVSMPLLELTAKMICVNICMPSSSLMTAKPHRLFAAWIAS